MRNYADRSRSAAVVPMSARRLVGEGDAAAGDAAVSSVWASRAAPAALDGAAVGTTRFHLAANGETDLVCDQEKP